jgi:hypothetical protein
MTRTAWVDVAAPSRRCGDDSSRVRKVLAWKMPGCAE